ncbi:MAG: DNA methyltransferase [Fimbriimonas sp.]
MADERTKNADLQVGQFVAPREVPDYDAATDRLPAQEEFFRPPVRFGSVPVEEKPLGFDARKGYKKLFPPIMLPTQVVERVSFGHPELEPNRLFWGDNLHVMRSLPSESIDLIYIDPPFFSGRNYNVIFGDKNELRSFKDTWAGGMPGYLIWLNARLVEMKRLLKPTGSLFVHLDWHASHYVKVELDKIFGFGGEQGKGAGFKNEIVWSYRSGGNSKKTFARKHDVILFYSKSPDYKFNVQYYKSWQKKKYNYNANYPELWDDEEQSWYHLSICRDVWEDINVIGTDNRERIGYPTQKPESLLARIIEATSDKGDVVADFFVGGGTTLAVAEKLGRRWIGCDQSRVAVALTSDRLANVGEQQVIGFDYPDFTVEHWGVYEKERLAQTPLEGFREFVMRAYGGVPDASEAGIHGRKGAVPVWVGEPSLKSRVTAKQVVDFANAIKKSLRYQQDTLRDGIMLAWSFQPDALQAAQELRDREQTNLDFIRLEQVRIDSPQFREHITALTTDHADYENFLTFVQPPKVELGFKKLQARTYLFDVSETALMNPGAQIINVQWDFDYQNRFTSTQGYSFVRGAKGAPAMQAQYTFETPGRKKIAVKVQDDVGGEGIHILEITVD